jgi:hypothetical protein
MWKKVILLFVLAFLISFSSAPQSTQAAGCDPNNIIFSEIDYDQPGTDSTEFLEMRIISTTTISNCEIRLINGANDTVYDTIDISGTWGPNKYLTIGSTGVNNRDLTFGNGSCASNCLQNGSPDGFALVDTTGAGTVVWFYSYEGTITGYDAGDGNAVDSTELPVSDYNTSPNKSIINGPAAGVSDSTTTENPTPGAANQKTDGTPNAVTIAEMNAINGNGTSNTIIIVLLAGFSALLLGGFWLRHRFSR